MDDTMKGRANIRITGVLFFLSALFQLLSLTSPVPMFGALRSGFPALLFHIIYIILFLLMGISLWEGRKWGVKMIVIGTSFFTLDRLILLLYPDSMQLHIDQLLWYRPDIEYMFDMIRIQQAFVVTNILFILAWWGFALYIYYRRAYFQK